MTTSQNILQQRDSIGKHLVRDIFIRKNPLIDNFNGRKNPSKYSLALKCRPLIIKDVLERLSTTLHQNLPYNILIFFPIKHFKCHC